jgi:hypothetical protein
MKKYTYYNTINAADYATRAVSGDAAQEYDKLMHDMFEDFQDFITAIIVLQIQKNKLVATGETLQSLAVELHKQGAVALYELQINFADNARFQDFLKALYRKRPALGSDEDGLIQWVKSKGISNFKYISGQKPGTIPNNNSKAALRLAWAIAESLHDKYDGTKRNKAGGWYSQTILPETYRFMSITQGASASFLRNFFYEALKTLEIQA